MTGVKSGRIAPRTPPGLPLRTAASQEECFSPGLEIDEDDQRQCHAGRRQESGYEQTCHGEIGQVCQHNHGNAWGTSMPMADAEATIDTACSGRYPPRFIAE